MVNLLACEAADPLAPPAIRFGEDECAVCRMIVSDDRYAAGIVILDERERHQKLAFDDIGCVFEYEAQQPEARILARYVRALRSSEWLDATTAELIHSRDLHTPMAFGIAAAESLEEAREIQREFGGDLITLAEARRRFQRGELHISSLDGGPAAPVLLENEKTLRLDDGRDLRLTLRTPQILPPGRHPFELEAHVRRGGGDWSPAEGIELRIEPDMPSMGHGSPGNEHPQPQGGNEAALQRGLVNFTMAGPWVVHVTVRADGRDVGRTTFAFEVRR